MKLIYYVSTTFLFLLFAYSVIQLYEDLIKIKMNYID